MPAAKRVILLGLDGMTPPIVERFLAEGSLPQFARLWGQGCFSRIRSVIPPQTPTNWHTVATGATPGTHGVIEWGTHLPGDALWEDYFDDAFTAGVCQAEYLWEAAARQGKRSVVMYYAGFPPTTEAATFIDWLFMPPQSYFDLAEPTVYTNCPAVNTKDPVTVQLAADWRNLPPSRRQPREATIPVVTTTEGTGPTYRLLIWSEEGAYDRALLAREKDAAAPVACLKVGEWSEWVYADFNTADQGAAQGAFRFKLVELSPDGERVQLFRSEAYPTDGRFCSEPELGKELIAALGPYINAGMTADLHCLGRLDWNTVDELLADEAEWWVEAAKIAMEQKDASILVLHWHPLDLVGHRFAELVEPTSVIYDPDKEAYAWDVFRYYYRAADRFVGAFLEQFDDGETVFAIVSDHGTPANAKAVSLINAFKHRGWVALTPDGTGVDWARSKVYFRQNHLWINLAGRQPQGTVSPEDYLALRAEVLATMRDIKDPETGEHVYTFVLTREDAPMVGLWGDSIGDLVYAHTGTYIWSGPEVLWRGEEHVVFPVRGASHGPMVPTFETKATSALGALFLFGPGVRAGARLSKVEQAKVCTTDVAPTVCYLLGMEPPAQNEGRVLQEFLSDFPGERPKRMLQSTARPIRNRKPVQPQPYVQQGDVTDERW